MAALNLDSIAAALKQQIEDFQAPNPGSNGSIELVGFGFSKILVVYPGEIRAKEYEKPIF